MGTVPLVHRRLEPGSRGLPHMRVRSPVVAVVVVVVVVVEHIHSRQRLEFVSRHVWGNVSVMPELGGLHPFQQDA